MLPASFIHDGFKRSSCDSGSKNSATDKNNKDTNNKCTGPGRNKRNGKTKTSSTIMARTKLLLSEDLMGLCVEDPCQLGFAGNWKTTPGSGVLSRYRTHFPKVCEE